ncbi:transposase [Mycoavidus sp. SF9855]|uniref:transposase n=1 Tax=Mycoavidus sp. SF9855 TaxID=2968475 RepID=UPI00211CC8D5|nr:transposase [Mycoavidus sp. SF9855]UUM21259.1 transposase [Mycoavidus sp. SF9855]
MLTKGRKSVEPMAARVHPEDICSAHHLVTQSEWSDRSLLETVSGKVLSALTQSEIEKSV